MQSNNLFTDLLRDNRSKLWLNYSLSLGEQLLGLLVPWAMGKAINDLLKIQYTGLLIFVALWVILAILTAARKMYDTRVFMGIYTDVVSGVIKQQREAGVPAGKLVARSILVREVVEFFERDIPDIFAMVIAFIGSLVMLTLFDWHITLIAVVMLVPVLALNITLWRPINRINRSLNNSLERQTRVINQGSETRLWRHFSFLRFLRVKNSDIEGRTWLMIELFVVLASVNVFMYTTAMPGIEAGTVFSTVTYFWEFQGSLDRLPILMQSVSRVKDILFRIGQSDD
ncbi:ABC transporter six-transmembrane domain-containing protein [Crenothrix polyspora]|uniref:Putative ABC-type multidrug transport system, ATPase and permease components n=1 Tax=Crenothrix polyspora TaxID=360316 RepID=A0A1R4HIN0_9GAMM|nr:ABC transporter six-transmembrane domain-containing protein [Crenothrix polyspora]SJM96094.1 putative ABC-type multidrug transport system, ATPase and permease components [Crenothrix polyspora]